MFTNQFIMKFITCSFYLFFAICIVSCSKDDEYLNYEIIKVQEIDKSSLKSGSSTGASEIKYTVICPLGNYSCGTTFGPVCIFSSECAPSPPMRESVCLDLVNKACQTSIAPSPVCLVATSCPTPPDPPPRGHPMPCVYGPPSYGCYSGWNSGLPYCYDLIDCKTPPP